MKSLLVLLSFLLVSHAFTVTPEYNEETTPEYEYDTPVYETPDYDTTPYDTLEYDTTRYETPEYETPEYEDVSTPVYEETASSTPDWASTTDISQDVYTISCGVSYENTYYLSPTNFGNNVIFNISSNTAENTTYSNFQNCKVQFVTDVTPFSLTIVFKGLSLEYHPQCLFDSLCIHGVKFCGNFPEDQTFNYVIPAYNSYTITFSTDSSGISSGFIVLVYAYIATEYSHSYEPAGISYASSPADIREYRSESQGEYVDKCNVDNSPQPTQDYYQTNSPNYYDSTTNTWGDNRQVIQCQNGTSIHYYDLNDYNNGYGYGYGYNSYSGFAPSNNQEFVIRSDNFGHGYYSKDTSCEIKFRTYSKRKGLTLTLGSFHMESNVNCPFDVFCVKGNNLCGDHPNGTSYSFQIPRYSSLTIRIKTDGSVENTGVEAYALFYDVSDYDYGSYELTGGDGSREAGLQYSTVYDTDYQDKCSSDYQTATPYQYDTTTTNYQPVTAVDPRPCGSNQAIADFVKTLEDSIRNAQLHINFAESLLRSLQDIVS